MYLFRKTSPGIRSAILVAYYGYLQERAETKDWRLLNSKCILRLLSIWTWSALYRMSYVQLIPISFPSERSIVGRDGSLAFSAWPTLRSLLFYPTSLPCIYLWLYHDNRHHLIMLQLPPTFNI